MVIPRFLPISAQDVSPTFGDVTLIFRVGTVLATGLFDALAPYHPTAVGAYTRIERRPQEEWTLRNMNIATLYASYHAARGLFPHRESRLALYVDGLTALILRRWHGFKHAGGHWHGGRQRRGIVGRLHDGLNQVAELCKQHRL